MLVVAATLLISAAACRQDMHDQPRYEPLQTSAIFADGAAARPPVEGTVARGQLRTDAHLYTGRLPGDGPARFVQEFPFAISAQDLDRGQERYDVFCSVCHGRLGEGDGMVVRRGFRRPASLHDRRLIEAPAGYFFDVITHGFGAMYPYRSRIDAADRWRITAYIRALQLSQTATVADLPAELREELD